MFRGLCVCLSLGLIIGMVQESKACNFGKRRCCQQAPVVCPTTCCVTPVVVPCCPPAVVPCCPPVVKPVCEAPKKVVIKRIIIVRKRVSCGCHYNSCCHSPCGYHPVSTGCGCGTYGYTGSYGTSYYGDYSGYGRVISRTFNTYTVPGNVDPLSIPGAMSVPSTTPIIVPTDVPLSSTPKASPSQLVSKVQLNSSVLK